MVEDLLKSINNKPKRNKIKKFYPRFLSYDVKFSLSSNSNNQIYFVLWGSHNNIKNLKASSYFSDCSPHCPLYARLSFKCTTVHSGTFFGQPPFAMRCTSRQRLGRESQQQQQRQRTQVTTENREELAPSLPLFHSLLGAATASCPLPLAFPLCDSHSRLPASVLAAAMRCSPACASLCVCVSVCASPLAAGQRRSRRICAVAGDLGSAW